MIDRLIDQEVFNARKAKLVEERLRLSEELRRSDEIWGGRRKLRQFLELIKSVEAAYHFGNPMEKRRIVEIATSNRVVMGKTPYIEPSDWTKNVQNALLALNGPPVPDTSRTSTDPLADLSKAYETTARAMAPVVQ